MFALTFIIINISNKISNNKEINNMILHFVKNKFLNINNKIDINIKNANK